MSFRAIRLGSAPVTPPRTVISTSPFSNSALIWASSLPAGKVIARLNDPWKRSWM